MRFNLNIEPKTNPELLENYRRDREITLFPFRNGTLPQLPARVKAQLVLGSEIALLIGPSGTSHLHIWEPLKRGRSIKRLGLLGIICREANSGNWPAVKAFFQKEADRFGQDMLVETSNDSSQEIREEAQKIAQSYRNLACSLGV